MVYVELPLRLCLKDVSSIQGRDTMRDIPTYEHTKYDFYTQHYDVHSFTPKRFTFNFTKLMLCQIVYGTW